MNHDQSYEEEVEAVLVYNGGSWRTYIYVMQVPGVAVRQESYRIRWSAEEEYSDRKNNLCRDPEARRNLVSSMKGKTSVVLKAFIHLFNTLLLSALL